MAQGGNNPGWGECIDLNSYCVLERPEDAIDIGSVVIGRCDWGEYFDDFDATNWENWLSGPDDDHFEPSPPEYDDIEGYY